MPLSVKAVRAQIAMLQPLLRNCSLETIRKGQNKLGELMRAKHSSRVLIKKHTFSCFDGSWVIPRDERRQGVLLYLHGGGYTCGDLQYAEAFSSVLAGECGVRTLAIAYRLAPENPYPAALDDAIEAYQYLLNKGYDSKHITLCGESAGGGLCYALCLRIRNENLPMPGAVIAISPWTDLTLSGSSYESNKSIDPTMTREVLDFYAKSYCKDRKDPYVSPIFGDLAEMPPSLIFVGDEEIMRSDAADMHKKLIAAGRHSELIVAPERWHTYLLYGFAEDKKDFATINKFLNKYVCQADKLHWTPLDNAAKIYPAARRKNWSSVFRLSATLNENVDTEVLQSALDVVVRRFPVLCARLRKGVFWYYLQQVEQAPTIQSENSFPLVDMSVAEMRKCAFRVIVFNKRIAVEMFHSLTDGNGALVFLKTLLAEYLQQKYGIAVPATDGVRGRLEEPTSDEMEDSFQKYAGPVSLSRKGVDSWQILGTPEADGFKNITCFRIRTDDLVAKAKECGVSVTVFLSAVLMDALQNMQAEKIRNPLWRNAIKIQIPVNLRNLFPSKTLRNFVYYAVPEMDPRLGHYSFQELCDIVHACMVLEVNPKFMSSLIAANINKEHILAIRMVPLFVKNLVMKAAYDSSGDKKTCLSISNLGLIKLPDVMRAYIDRFDFIIGVRALSPYNCAVVSYDQTTYINFIRNIKESELEYHFFKVLQNLGLDVEAESNSPQ